MVEVGQTALGGAVFVSSTRCCGIVGGGEGADRADIPLDGEWHGGWLSFRWLRSLEIVGVPKREGCGIGSAGSCCRLFCGGAAGCNWARLRRRTRSPVSTLQELGDCQQLDHRSKEFPAEMDEVLRKHGNQVAVAGGTVLVLVVLSFRGFLAASGLGAKCPRIWRLRFE